MEKKGKTGRRRLVQLHQIPTQAQYNAIQNKKVKVKMKTNKVKVRVKIDTVAQISSASPNSYTSTIQCKGVQSLFLILTILVAEMMC